MKRNYFYSVAMEISLVLSFFFLSDKESILCERQHGHFLSKCKQQTNDLVNKCEKLNQKIQQLKPTFDRCEQLLSEDMEMYESVGIVFVYFFNFMF